MGTKISTGFALLEDDAGNPAGFRRARDGKEFPLDVVAAQALASGAGKNAYRSFTPIAGGPGLSLSDVTVQGSGVTSALVTGPNGQPAIQLTTAVGGNVELVFPGAVGSVFGGEACVLAGGGRQTGLDTVTVYVSQGDATYTNWVVSTVQYGLAAPVGSTFEQGGAVNYHFRKSAFTPTGTTSYPMPIGQTKIRFTALAGQAATVLFYGFGIATPTRKGRICVIWDDGYQSSARLGFQSFASRGIKQTVAVIGSMVGSASYINLNELQAFYDTGNAIVPHGPWPTDGASQTSNIVDLYAATSDPVGNAVNDARLHRDWIQSQRLLRPGAEKCYVWPQGKFQNVSGDVRYLDAMIAAGFTCARGVGNLIGGTNPAGINFDVCGKYNAMALPLIGHLWAGTTAAEATNITAITTAIGNLATHKQDACLMLHRVLPSSTNDAGMGAASNITIRVSDLETIAEAIKTQVDAGTLEAVTMPELAVDTWWRRF